jgi:SNF2 family DNA or RNA helicase
VAGKDSTEAKTERLRAFVEGKARVLISKPKVAGWGLNLQHCPNVAFVGLSDSFEAYYQSIRRCWRFGQKRTVHCYLVTSELEGAVVANIKRKETDAGRLVEEMVRHMSALNADNIKATGRQVVDYLPTVDMALPEWFRRAA